MITIEFNGDHINLIAFCNIKDNIFVTGAGSLNFSPCNLCIRVIRFLILFDKVSARFSQVLIIHDHTWLKLSQLTKVAIIPALVASKTDTSHKVSGAHIKDKHHGTTTLINQNARISSNQAFFYQAFQVSIDTRCRKLLPSLARNLVKQTGAWHTVLPTCRANLNIGNLLTFIILLGRENTCITLKGLHCCCLFDIAGVVLHDRSL